MKAGEKVVVTLDALGRPSIEAIGFTGTACEVATKLLEEALTGSNTKADKKIKPEWNAQEKRSHEVQQQRW